MNKNILKNQKGAIALITLMVIGVFALAMMTTMSVLATSELKMSSSGLASEKTFYAAEAGINEALYKLANNSLGTTYSFKTSDNIDVTINKTTDPNIPLRVKIESAATDSTQKVRKLQLTVDAPFVNPFKDYAIQTGKGGFDMAKGVTVIGNIFANGSVSGKGMINNPNNEMSKIQGNLTVAESVCPDLNGQACINNVHVTGNAWALKIDPSVVVDHNNALCLGYLPLPNCSSYTTPPVNPLPDITGAITLWKNETNCSNPCDPTQYHIFTTAQTTSGTTTWNYPHTIVRGNLTVSGTLTLGGTLRVEGTLTLNQNAQLKLGGTLYTNNIIFDSAVNISAPNLGKNSVVVISDGAIDMAKEPTLKGSDDPNSYILIISLYKTLSNNDPSISIKKSSAASLYYAPDGTLQLDKGTGEVTLSAAIAKTISWKKEGQVIYGENIPYFTTPATSGKDSPSPVPYTWTEL